MKYFLSCVCLYFLSLNFSIAQQTDKLLNKDDLLFLENLTKAVLDSSRIKPGVIISSNFGPNNTGGMLIRPGGKEDYPAFWIRDYAMALETGMIGSKEQRHMLLLTASTQCDQTWITKNGSMVPYGSIADHIRIDNSLPIYFPGTYDYKEQGNKYFGMVPPYCDQFYFIQMAWYYVKMSGDIYILNREINGTKLIDRLEIAFKMPPADLSNQVVYTDSSFRGVDFGFRDGIEITGHLCLPSILKYRAAQQLEELFSKLKNKSKANHYTNIARQIRQALPEVFLDNKGMLRASTGKSNQPDVWATALAIYYNILEKDVLKKACTVLAEAYENGSLAFKGNIRHVLTRDDYNNNTAWEMGRMEKNRYQNGAYWGTATGWVCYAIAKVNTGKAKILAKEYIDDLKENDFRKGNGLGAPYECFYPPDYKQNPLYLATVACPYSVFKNIFISESRE
ncbi:MAG: hypothetical protein JST09_05530 [Bacteroidetes bacterium]|nr:hypothetical protein [Bacteroidota bacterium]